MLVEKYMQFLKIRSKNEPEDVSECHFVQLFNVTLQKISFGFDK